MKGSVSSVIWTWPFIVLAAFISVLFGAAHFAAEIGGFQMFATYSIPLLMVAMWTEQRSG